MPSSVKLSSVGLVFSSSGTGVSVSWRITETAPVASGGSLISGMMIVQACWAVFSVYQEEQASKKRTDNKAKQVILEVVGSAIEAFENDLRRLDTHMETLRGYDKEAELITKQLRGVSNEQIFLHVRKLKRLNTLAQEARRLALEVDEIKDHLIPRFQEEVAQCLRGRKKQQIGIVQRLFSDAQQVEKAAQRVAQQVGQGLISHAQTQEHRRRTAEWRAYAISRDIESKSKKLKFDVELECARHDLVLAIHVARGALSLAETATHEAAQAVHSRSVAEFERRVSVAKAYLSSASNSYARSKKMLEELQGEQPPLALRLPGEVEECRSALEASKQALNGSERALQRAICYGSLRRADFWIKDALKVLSIESHTPDEEAALAQASSSLARAEELIQKAADAANLAQSSHLDKLLAVAQSQLKEAKTTFQARRNEARQGSGTTSDGKKPSSTTENAYAEAEEADAMSDAPHSWDWFVEGLGTVQDAARNIVSSAVGVAERATAVTTEAATVASKFLHDHWPFGGKGNETT